MSEKISITERCWRMHCDGMSNKEIGWEVDLPGNTVAAIISSRRRVLQRRQSCQAEQRRFRELQDIGCIACRLEGYPRTPGDIHHLVDGYCIGHGATICLCPWHHRGETEGHMAPSRMELIKGPSLARNKRAFVERYGSERELLARVDALLGDTA